VIDNPIFMTELARVVYDYSGSYEFKEIIEVIGCEMMINELRYDRMKFYSNIDERDISERNVDVREECLNL
jgi:hypothetical protein